MLKEISDQQLWLNIKNGNSQEDFIELYHRYWEKLYTNAFYKLKDRDASANIVQDIFVTLWRRREFLNIECVPTYLGCAVKYSIFRELRKRKKEKSLLTGNISLLSPVAANDGSYELTYKSLEQQVEKELNKLPRRCKEIFLLSRQNQLTSSEIASFFNISKRTVDNQITLALAHLRVSIKDIITFFIVLSGLFS